MVVAHQKAGHTVDNEVPILPAKHLTEVLRFGEQLVIFLCWTPARATPRNSHVLAGVSKCPRRFRLWRGKWVTKELPAKAGASSPVSISPRLLTSVGAAMVHAGYCDATNQCI